MNTKFIFKPSHFSNIWAHFAAMNCTLSCELQLPSSHTKSNLSGVDGTESPTAVVDVLSSTALPSRYSFWFVNDPRSTYMLSVLSAVISLKDPTDAERREYSSSRSTDPDLSVWMSTSEIRLISEISPASDDVEPANDPSLQDDTDGAVCGVILE